MWKGCSPEVISSIVHSQKANGLPLDGEGIQAWLEWEWEARWRVPVEISKADLQALVESSVVVLDREKHRLVHRDDWRWWGSRGGRETLRRYGAGWFVLLARRRWGRIGPEELEAARVPSEACRTEQGMGNEHRLKGP